MDNAQNRSQKTSKFFNQSVETMDWSQRQKLLEKRFLSIFRLALAQSPAYREIYAEAGIDAEAIRGLGDLERLPVVSMKDMIERQRKDPPWGGFATTPPERIRRIYVNPGFIFQPGEWEYTDNSWAEAVAAAGFGPQDRVMNTFNYHLWPFAFMIDESLKMNGATVIPTGVGNIFLQVRIMRQLEVNGFVGTPSFLMTLAQRAEGLGLNPKTDLFLEKALVGAEALPESLRESLQDKLGMSILQCYGTVFLGCLGYECPHAQGLHVPDNVLVEVVDPQTGHAVPQGTPGEIVATNVNPGFPLIRMATGDLSRFIFGQCPCGRTGPRLSRIMGRIDQAAKVRGTFVHPWQADEVMGGYPEVFKYQVVITRENHTDHMTFWVELVEEAADPAGLKERMEKNLKEMLTVKGEVKIVQRGTIPDFHKTIVDRRKWD